MKKLAFIFCCVLYAAMSFGQSQIKGKLVDKDSKEVMPAAAVALLRSSDSSVVQTAVTDNDGNFTMSGMGNGSFRIFVTFIGYKPVYRSVIISSANPQTNLGEVGLSRKGLSLNEVEIVQEKPPVVVKQDTLEFNAGSFKTRENAVVEDLVAKLPGVTVAKDGTITAQGQQVTRILVDGKPFFGTDPKLATKNLPADIVDKVQIIDRKSDQAQFTGIDDGNIEKAINIVLKPEKRKGYFGRATAGYGTDERFAGTLTANRFRDNQQLSILGGGNNVNNLGFTAQDVFNFANGNGGGGRGGGGGSVKAGSVNVGGLSIGSSATGVTRNWNGGINYNQDVNTKLKVSGSYFYNDSKTQKEQTSQTQYFLKTQDQRDSTYFYNAHSKGTTEGANQRADMRIEYAPDTMNSIIFTPSFTYNKGHNLNTNEYTSYDSSKTDILNKGFTQNISDATSPNISGNLLYRKKFATRGRTFSANISAGHTSTDRDDQNLSNTEYALKNGDLAYDTINQHNLQHSVTNNSGIRLTYTEPLSKTRFLELAYNYNQSSSVSSKNTFDYNKLTDRYDLLNDSLSNSFNNTSHSQQGSINIRTQKLKYGYTIGISMQDNDLKSNNISKDSVVHQHTMNFFPLALFNYNFAKGKRLQFTYRGSTTQPTVQQLQPVPDNSNPQVIQLGNPDLKTAFTHNMQLRYNSFNAVTMHGLFTNISATINENQIVNYSTNDAQGRQEIKPMNVNGNYSLNGFITNIIPVKGQQHTSFSLSTNASYSQNSSYTNGKILVDGVEGFGAVKNPTRALNLKESVNFNYAYKELFDFILSGSGNYNNSSSLLQSTTNYFDYDFGFDFNVNLPLGFIIGSDIDYSITTGRGKLYDQQIAMLNGFISKSVFKKKQGLIKIQGYDLLRQNVSISRTVTDNYIQDANNVVLQRYFMISFTYFLNKFGGNTGGNNRGPGGGRFDRGGPGGGGGGFRRG